MNQFPSKNYFTLPNEIFSLGLSAGEIAVYAYLRCLENPSAGPATPRLEKLLAVLKIRSCSMSMRSRRKDSSPQSQPLS